MSDPLLNGGVFDENFELDGGLVNVMARISIEGDLVTLIDVAFYPLTSGPLKLGVGDVLRVFRSVSDQAKAEGFSRCSADGYRATGARPGRMIYLTRRLR